MLKTYSYAEFPYRQSEAQRRGQTPRFGVVVIGGGPVGLSLALDAARRGLAVQLLDDNNTVSIGSRAVCYAKRPLEIWRRLGVDGPLLERGVRWQIGKVFYGDTLAYQFDLLPEQHHQMPAMVNLQQYYLEETLVAACEANEHVTLNWKHKVVGLEQVGSADPHVRLTVETPDGRFDMLADWVVACDGANSDTRRMLGADFSGQVFNDRFLIADVVMDPSTQPVNEASGAQRLSTEPERWFWFDPPFHRGQSVLLHKQADKVWRIDFQLGRDADPVEEKKPENVLPRIKAMLGENVDFELEWVSVYQFACRRMDQFRHGRVLFAGDAAHQVSPFGARGANSGVQDSDNLAWKLQWVVSGQAPEALLDSYHDERSLAADDNIANSTRSTDFITPKSRASLRLRNAVLELARTEPFARPMVNSGRLSLPTPYLDSPLNTPDTDTFAGLMRPGTVCADAPLMRHGQATWLLDVLGEGDSPFAVLVFGDLPEPLNLHVPVRLLRVGTDVQDAQGVLAARYDAQPGTVYLVRPDQHVAARWRRFDAAAVQTALQRAAGGAKGAH